MHHLNVATPRETAVFELARLLRTKSPSPRGNTSQVLPPQMRESLAKDTLHKRKVGSFLKTLLSWRSYANDLEDTMRLRLE